MRCAVIHFPGSHSHHDCFEVLSRLLNQEVFYIGHHEQDLQGAEFIILPGGFSYGDFLRPGALAALAPIMALVKQAAYEGKVVLGIGNGFQILCEAGLLPGALMKNSEGVFRSDIQSIRVENGISLFTRKYLTGQVLQLPIAHGSGHYFVDKKTLYDLEVHQQILLTYCKPDGSEDSSAPSKESAFRIAGICNRSGNVIGMMPHPERACEAILGSEDGKLFFESVIEHYHQEKTCPLQEATPPQPLAAPVKKTATRSSTSQRRRLQSPQP